MLGIQHQADRGPSQMTNLRFSWNMGQICSTRRCYSFFARTRLLRAQAPLLITAMVEGAGFPMVGAATGEAAAEGRPQNSPTHFSSLSCKPGTSLHAMSCPTRWSGPDALQGQDLLLGGPARTGCGKQKASAGGVHQVAMQAAGPVSMQASELHSGLLAFSGSPQTLTAAASQASWPLQSGPRRRPIVKADPGCHFQHLQGGTVTDSP